MKNNFLIIFFSISIFTNSLAENLLIQAKNISLDKDGQTSVFKDEVIITTQEKTIKSDYVKYNKKTGFLLIKDNIRATDSKKNIIEAEQAEFYEKDKILISKGPTKIITSDKYQLNGSNIKIDNINKTINSEDKSLLTDLDGNQIFLDSFDYLIEKNIFKSAGLIKIIDNKKNIFEFSQIYIDTKKKEILGTDIKAFFNDKNFKINDDNDPRIFANSLKTSKNESSFVKSVFTLCKFRENDKCPPWSIQSSKMLHDNKKNNLLQ